MTPRRGRGYSSMKRTRPTSLRTCMNASTYGAELALFVASTGIHYFAEPCDYEIVPLPSSEVSESRIDGEKHGT